MIDFMMREVKCIAISALCILLNVCEGQIVQNGQCDPEIELVDNFMIEKFIGTWYEIQRSDSPQQNTDCASFDITVNGNTINIKHHGVNDNFEEDSSGTVDLSSGLAKLVLDITIFDNPMDFWVLLTDYENFAVTYSCENISRTERKIYLWVLSRQVSFTNELIIAHISTILDKILAIDVNSLKHIDHSDAACYSLPLIEPGETIIIPGQCDPNIPIEQNFKLSEYTGLWYTIEAYPEPLQTGTCSRTDYSLKTDDSLILENIQVVNYFLDVNNGSATITTNDGSAKLDVTFNIDGKYVTNNYWVLATDYDSYALVYSCENINEDFKSVYSWKLSRTPTLTAEANAAIDSIINSVLVLNQRYYNKNGHTVNDCFYYPYNNGGDVLLPGNCIDYSAVPAITDFDAALFNGTWYEVSRFPSDIQQGECDAVEFIMDDSFGFTISHTSVKDERQTRLSTESIYYSDGTAVINVNGGPFKRLYILATDYSEYALAYSCRNIDDQTKQIYSWKLSRSRSDFSDAANAAINEVVSSFIDLWEGYYQTTKQDDDTCFYYPVFDEVPPYIELPGPCPDSIQGIADFNTNAYLGRWFEVARYPNTEQLGQCGRVDLTQNNISERNIFIVKTEVADETLLTQRGISNATTSGSGQINVDYIVDGEFKTINYYILATDYRSYSLVYSCTNTDNGNSRVSSWQLSRTPTLRPQAAAAMVPAIVNTRGLIEEYYQPTGQTEEDCFYIPSFKEDQALIFRGQCENITGIEDFDAERYAGYWHEIERYPMDNSGGECRSSEYIQNGDTYRVVDTQVQNNEGTVVTGTVTISPDGKLHRTIPDKPDQVIWVLATDYDTYALLYSCQNIDNEYKTVWSAKHSKSRSLTAAAQNAMNSVIASNRVLHEKFYINVNQSDSACFYYPAVTDDKLIIPGQCDEAIPVVQNFNASAFAGTWYQIEKYDEVGESSCLGSKCTVDERSVNISVLNFLVRNKELKTAVGSASIISTDGSAKLKMNLDYSEDDTITMRVSILATDYRSFALAYACTNINKFQRQVRAWKLSRTRTLSTAGTKIINNLIRQRQELHQPYFKHVEQNEQCPEPTRNSALLLKNSIILFVLCALLLW